MRELFVTLSELEDRLIDEYGVSLNEAMTLCRIGLETVTTGVIVDGIGMRAYHTSKLVRAVKGTNLLRRKLGEKDKCQMYFT